ncbi:hypothetical protein AVEN_24466-1 [Araneus ventricosus]|uniref:Uncharacterized protein n=1 Tax=Araneus ventricosus TaxID=182803 RepID=A0A4Y2PZ74_ARAVE|nr:hypothetical protein AVEN_24466-1 [Araneus ventricosus]
MCSILDYILKQHYSKTGSNEPLVAFGLVAGGFPGLAAKRNTNMGQILLKVISEGNPSHILVPSQTSASGPLRCSKVAAPIRRCHTSPGQRNRAPGVTHES